VAETSRAQQKAKEAAAAVDAVSSAAQQLGAVDTATNNTLGSLTAAAAALNTIAAPKDGTGSIKGPGGSDRQQQPSVWDLKGRIEQHKQKVGMDFQGHQLQSWSLRPVFHAAGSPMVEFLCSLYHKPLIMQAQHRGAQLRGDYLCRRGYPCS